MTRTKFTFGLIAAAAAMALPGTAHALAWVVNGSNTGASQIINFDGIGGTPVSTINGLTSSLVLTFTGKTGNDYVFNYLMTNTSGAPITGSRVSVFGFNVDPVNVSGVSSTGDYNSAIFGSFNIPNQGTNLEVCFKDSTGNSCAGGGGDGAAVGDPYSGTLTLKFASSLNEITLSNFLVRYQSIVGAANGATSASGSGSDGNTAPPPPAVPEPATWMMMLLGFGLVGASMRHRKGIAFRAQFA